MSFAINALLMVSLSLQCTTILAAPPTVDGLPDIIYVGEQESGSRVVFFYGIADPNGNSFNCSNTVTANAGTATGIEFDLRKNTDNGNYELWATPSTTCCTYNHTATQSYGNTITCTDSVGETSTPLTLTASIVDGERVSLTNVEGTTNDILITNTLGTPAELTLKTITASTLKGHEGQITYNLSSSNPSFDPEFFKVTSSGVIKTNRALEKLDSGTPVVYLTISATDTQDGIKTYVTQQINLQQQNTIPTTTTLPKSDSLLESTAAGTVLFKVSVSDPDSSQSHTYRFTCTPDTACDTFEIDTNGNFKIAAGKSMNYEAITFYNVSVYIDDTIHEGGPFIYQLTVLNDNEAPVFGDTMYYATVSEGAAGSQSFSPGFTCTDPDVSDTTTYDFQVVNNSDRFAISSAGVMTFATDYDIDNSAMPSTVVLTVYCIDNGGSDGKKAKLTGSAQVTITITDANDNEPAFASSAYTITVDQYTTPGNVIGTITPTDIDTGSNAALTCTSTSGSTYSSYVTVGQDCNIYLSKTIDFSPGTVISYTMLAKDDGTPVLTGTAALEVVYRETTTTTTTTAATTTEYNFFDHAENIAMFVLLLLAGLALLGLLTWCLLKMCCGPRFGNMCDCMGRRHRAKRYPLRQVTPQTPPQRKFRPPTPEYRQQTPPRMEQRRGVLVAQPVLTQMQRPGGFIRSAPNVPGFYR